MNPPLLQVAIPFLAHSFLQGGADGEAGAAAPSKGKSKDKLQAKELAAKKAKDSKADRQRFKEKEERVSARRDMAGLACAV